MKSTATRGRKPQISTARREVVALKRQARAVLTDLKRLESRLVMLDAYYAKSRSAATSRKTGQLKPGRKPNIRDIAAGILEGTGKPMAIAVLALRVAKFKGGKPGKMFAHNLGMALTLREDRRFRRVGRAE